MQFSEEWLAAQLKQNPALRVSGASLSPPTPVVWPDAEGCSPREVRRKRQDGYASALEAQYVEEILAPLMHSGGVEAWWYEGIKFELAPKTFYTPDFLVKYSAPGPLEVVEVKGWWREEARVKVKVVAARYHCFRFVGMQRLKGLWVPEYFPAR